VSNTRYLAEDRRYMEQLLAYFASRPDRIDDAEVVEVVSRLKHLHDAFEGNRSA
jgi:hypothetical protein